MKHMATTNCISIHHRNNRFWDTADELLHIENVKAGNSILPNVPGMAFYILVATTTKGFIAFAG
jgi:hypothetical protein